MEHKHSLQTRRYKITVITASRAYILQKWFKYHPPIELNEEPVSVKEETIVYNVDPVVPTTYIEKPPFPVRIKEHAKVSTVVNKSNIRAPRPSEKLKLNPMFLWLKIS